MNRARTFLPRGSASIPISKFQRAHVSLFENMSIDVKGLIELVKRYPLLYDMSTPLYLDYQKKDEAWNEIATVTGLTGK